MLIVRVLPNPALSLNFFQYDRNSWKPVVNGFNKDLLVPFSCSVSAHCMGQQKQQHLVQQWCQALHLLHEILKHTYLPPSKFWNYHLSDFEGQSIVPCVLYSLPIYLQLTKERLLFWSTVMVLVLLWYVFVLMITLFYLINFSMAKMRTFICCIP